MDGDRIVLIFALIILLLTVLANRPKDDTETKDAHCGQPDNDKPDSEQPTRQLTPEEEVKVQKIMAIYEEIGIEKIKAMSKEELDELNDDIEVSFIIKERMGKREDKQPSSHESDECEDESKMLSEEEFLRVVEKQNRDERHAKIRKACELAGKDYNNSFNDDEWLVTHGCIQHSAKSKEHIEFWQKANKEM